MSRTTHHSSPARRLSARLDVEDYAYHVWPRSAPKPDGDAYPGAPGRHTGVQTWHESATLRYPASETDRADRDQPWFDVPSCHTATPAPGMPARSTPGVACSKWSPAHEPAPA